VHALTTVDSRRATVKPEVNWQNQALALKFPNRGGI